MRFHLHFRYKQENPDKVPVDYDDEEEGWVCVNVQKIKYFP